VIGAVTVDFISQETLASVITTTIHVGLDSISLVIVVTRVHQLLGTDITQRLIAVIGLVRADTTNQAIAVSVITQLLVV
jgi:hypothetical protein